MLITLLGEPKTTNHLYKSHCRFGHPCVYMTASGKSLKESYQWQAKNQWKRKMITDQEIGVDIKLFFGTKRNGDIDNYGKILLDSLTGIVWEDDKQIVTMNIEKHYDKSNPRIELTVL